jgi:dephospho-CoA kinase
MLGTTKNLHEEHYPMILKIGLTGGIGSGKSMVANLVRQRGVPIISADQVAKDIMQTNPAVKAELIRAFGKDIYRADSTLDRRKVADIIFSDPAARARINAIVHPRVLQFQHDEMARHEADGQSMVGVEAALIFEAGSEHQFDVIVVVTASQHHVIERLKSRDGLTEPDILNRIAAQMPLAEKAARADYVIANDGTLEELEHEVERFMTWLTINDRNKIRM